jgi:multidrug efflux system membrane fusion protein
VTRTILNRAPALARLAGALALVACGGGKPEHPATVPVRVATAVRITAPVVISASGVVEPEQAVEVEAQVGGMLTEVAFREGDEVEQGQVLFRIDPNQYESAVKQAAAALARDEAQAASAQRDADRYKALVAKDFVTKSQADQAEATAAALRATVLADSAVLHSATINLQHATVRAPISGRTGSLLVRQGNLVKASGGSLVVINQIRPILVRFSLLQRDFIALAQRASSGNVPVSVVSADSVPVSASGTLTFIDNAVDSLTGTVTAKAQFANTTRALWPGEYVRVTVQLDVLPNVLAVPTPALMSGQSGAYVYVIDGHQQAVVRNVVAGRVVGELTVIDKGLTAGETVVVDGQSRLIPGSTVEVTKSTPPAPAGKSGT